MAVARAKVGLRMVYLPNLVVIATLTVAVGQHTRVGGLRRNPGKKKRVRPWSHPFFQSDG